MASAREERRLTALTKWAASAAARGHGVPTAEELAAIAADPTDWRDSIDSLEVRAWADAIAHVLHQDKFGVVADEIVRQLTDELAEPSEPVSATSAPAATDPSAQEFAPGRHRTGAEAKETPRPADAQTSLVSTLVEWRERKVAEGTPGADLIKEVTLRNLVKFGYTDGDTIGKKLPDQAAHLGTEIASIIGEFSQATAASAPGTPTPTPPAAPVAESPPILPPPPPPVSPPPPVRVSSVPPQPETPSQPAGGLLNLTDADFCEYQYPRSDSDEAKRTLEHVSATRFDGGVRLRFDAHVPEAGKMVIYRVVAGDGLVPRNPEAGELIGATTSLRIDDHRPLRTALRVYQVWCHVGIDLEDAALTNAFLLAQGQQISPVMDFAVHVDDGGRVSGEWTTFPGVNRVCVYRIPLDGSRIDDPQHEIRRGQKNDNGFSDFDASPGAQYLYRACAEVAVQGATQLSDPMEQEITVPAVLKPVDDLTISPNAHDPSRLDVAWTEPALGQVRVYWSNARPRAGVGQQQDFTKSQLAVVDGFQEQNRIKGPTDDLEGGRSAITSVGWPSDWPRVYVTPVTVLGEQVRVGVTRVEARPVPPVSNPRILERFDTEMVTFGWPKDAARVLAFVGSINASAEELVKDNEPVHQITMSGYERDGGITFERKLEAKGCSVALVPVSFSQGEAVHGEPAVLRYPGLHRLRYSLVPLRGNPTRFLNELRLTSELDIDSPIALTMVNNRDRLPLSPSDGEGVSFFHREGGDSSPQCLIEDMKKGEASTGWFADWTHQRGFFRLFVSSRIDATRRYALADPPIGSLFLSHDIPGPPQ